jgi:hypothetical protein
MELKSALLTFLFLSLRHPVETLLVPRQIDLSRLL